jgi:hypothetical protein
MTPANTQPRWLLEETKKLVAFVVEADERKREGSKRKTRRPSCKVESMALEDYVSAQREENAIPVNVSRRQMGCLPEA